ncbi:MAG TPA: chemotaxis protein CheX [Tepidisphaeraceae bacterium]|jgi:chemotaxis protein CheX|nr:chemotaxis protein CheX [Tepidisphaeraceae bacterium]
MDSAVAAPPAQVINPKMIVPFVNSVRQVFTKMVGVPTTVSGAQIKGSPAPSYDVSGIIGFSGEVTGSVVVSFQKQAAIKLVNALAGSEIEFGTADFADAIGELANMIAGSAKKDLNALANISIPSVIIGGGHVIARLTDVPCVVIPCTTPVGDFAVEVNIKQTKVS